MGHLIEKTGQLLQSGFSKRGGDMTCIHKFHAKVEKDKHANMAMDSDLRKYSVDNFGKLAIQGAIS